MNYNIIFGFLALSVGQSMVEAGPPQKGTKVSVQSTQTHAGPKAVFNNENTNPNQPKNMHGSQTLKTRNPSTANQKPSTNPTGVPVSKAPPPTLKSQNQNVPGRGPPNVQNQQRSPTPNQQRPQTPSQQRPSSQSRGPSPSSRGPSPSSRGPSPSSKSSTTSGHAGSQKPVLRTNSIPKLQSQVSMSRQQSGSASSSSQVFPEIPHDVQNELKGVLNVANEAISKEAKLVKNLSLLSAVDKANIDKLQKELTESNPQSGVTLEALPILIFNVLKDILLSEQFAAYVNYGREDNGKFVKIVNATLKVFEYLFNIPALPAIDPKNLPDSASDVIRELGKKINTDGFEVHRFLEKNKDALNRVLKDSPALKGSGSETFNVDHIQSHLQDLKGPSLVPVN